MTTEAKVRVRADGCRAHGISESQVAAWWATAAGRDDLEVSICICCAGPAPLDPPGGLCKRCGVADA